MRQPYTARGALVMGLVLATAAVVFALVASTS